MLVERPRAQLGDHLLKSLPPLLPLISSDPSPLLVNERVLFPYGVASWIGVHVESALDYSRMIDFYFHAWDISITYWKARTANRCNQDASHRAQAPPCRFPPTGRKRR